VTRLRGRLATTLAITWVAFMVVCTGPAYAADDASIDHAEHSSGKVRLLVSVPGTDPIDLTTVKATIDGKPVDSTAEIARTPTSSAPRSSPSTPATA